jgi:hypothetical protein
MQVIKGGAHKWGRVVTSLVSIRHNHMQWRHAVQYKHDWVKLADYAFFSVPPRVWYNRGINLGLLWLVVPRMAKLLSKLI